MLPCEIQGDNPGNGWRKDTESGILFLNCQDYGEKTREMQAEGLAFWHSRVRINQEHMAGRHPEAAPPRVGASAKKHRRNRQETCAFRLARAIRCANRAGARRARARTQDTRAKRVPPPGGDGGGEDGTKTDREERPMPKTQSRRGPMEYPDRKDSPMPETAAGHEPSAWPAMTKHDTARPPHDKT